MLTAYFKHKSLLHTVLRLNAAFSGIFGLLFILFPGAFSSWVGIPGSTGILIAGILLIGWEFFVLQLVKASQISTSGTWTVIVGDVLWVVGSIGLLLGGWMPLTLAGKWFVAIIADIVLVFAVVQYFSLRRQTQSA